MPPMRRYNVVHPLWMSFFSKDLYRDVGLHWRGVTFAYLLVLLAASWLPAMIRFDSGVRRFVRDDAPAIVKQIPRITIRDGRASTDVQQPHCIVDPEDDQCVAIIDTLGTTTSLEGTDARMLLTARRLIYARNDAETRVYSLHQIEDLTIDQDLAHEVLQFAARFLAVIAFPVVVLFSFCFRTIQALLFAVLGVVFTRFQGLRVDFAALFSLAVVALTPVIAVQTLLDIAGQGVAVPRLIFLAVGLGYLLFGIKACAETAAEHPLLPGQTGGTPPF